MADREPQPPTWSEVMAPLRAEIHPILRMLLSGLVLVGVFVILATPESPITTMLAIAWLVAAPPLLLVWNGSRLWPWFVFPFFALITLLPPALQPSPQVLARIPSLDLSLEGWTNPGMIAFISVWLGVAVLWLAREGKARITRGKKTDPPA